MMIPGVSGSLLSHDAYEHAIRDALRAVLDEPGSMRARAGVRDWFSRVSEQLGPTASARTVFDRVAGPLFARLGYRVVPALGTAEFFRATLEAEGRVVAGLLTTPWGGDADSAWRAAVRQGINLGVPWCFCATGPLVRVVDSRRTYSRRFVEVVLGACLESPRAFELVWGLLRAAAMARASPDSSALDRAVLLSEQHRAHVRESLQQGVQDALVHLHEAFLGAARRRSPSEPVRGEALTIVYRILFLLFAEARKLVPGWHPVYRDGYTIESLRDQVDRLPAPRGLWESLQAMSRLAHEGCRVGTLTVPPFNGRLFSPTQAPMSDTLPLDDGVVRRAVLALTTRPARHGRVRVAYGDLGVEQLGGIYERLLDFDPARSTTAAAERLSTGTRKATGSFYTPRAITEFLVRRTLAPFVRDASPEAILGLRVLDPAMGSGAFLVAACRYLASAYEAALVRDGGLPAADVSADDRVGFRRTVAQRCLFGVDLNPTAVELGRLSLWLTTLAADRPLTFLDHRLRVGNSLVGAGIEEVLRQPRAERRKRPLPLPLFDENRLESALEHAVAVRAGIAAEPDDTLEQVRRKERAVEALAGAPVLAAWKTAADLWCAAWYGSSSSAAYRALADGLLGRMRTLPDHLAAPLLATSRAIAAEQRFFHWTMEFPEIFHGPDGRPRADGGFDAVIGNPPWEMLRGDQGDSEARRAARQAAARLTSFVRSSGVYCLQRSGHANLYQCFLERTLSLLRTGGRLGLVLPSGLAIDHGSAGLRRALFERTALDGIVSIENRDGIFPIHRGLKFLLVTATTGSRSAELKCRFGVRAPALLDRLPDSGFDDESVTIPRALIDRLSGPGVVVPELRTPADVEIVTALAYRWPPLAEGWRVRFGRELNATDDRAYLSPAGRGLPVIEGKHLRPFAVDLSAIRLRIAPAAARRLLAGRRPFERARLGYRDVASSTNRLTLIAAILPARSVSTHTVFCLKDVLDEEAQHFLCGIFNSFVANYLVRSQIGTHVGASVIARLPVPTPDRRSPAFRALARSSRTLSRNWEPRTAARAQALAAALYGLEREQFRRLLGTFPIVAERERRAALDAFCDIVS